LLIPFLLLTDKLRKVQKAQFFDDETVAYQAINGLKTAFKPL
jgi:hypothetical protein